MMSDGGSSGRSGSQTYKYHGKEVAKPHPKRIGFNLIWTTRTWKGGRPTAGDASTRIAYLLESRHALQIAIHVLKEEVR